jgi:hypothetical protein
MKRLIKNVLLALAVVSIAAIGQNAYAVDTCDCKINLFGASAQFKYWTDAADDFLIAQGCDAGDVFQAEGELENRDAGIAICRGTNWTGSGGEGDGIGGATVCITYTTFASGEGVLAGIEQDPNDAENGNCGFPANPEQRRVADEATANTDGSLGALKCEDITIGVSDVRADSFRQQSNGNELGPETQGGINVINPVATPIPIPAGFTDKSSVAVPFAFFLNADEGPDGVSGTADDQAVPFDNITQSMAAVLYSGKIQNWNEFRPDLNGDGIPLDPAAYPTGDNLPVVLCLRHALSGTHATLDATVQSHTPENGALVQDEISTNFLADLLGKPLTFFNKGSSDAVECAGGRINTPLGDYVPIGAIAYADADKISAIAAGDNPDINGSRGDLFQPTYNGNVPSSDNVALGLYNFYSENHLFFKTDQSDVPAACPDGFFDSFIVYSDNPCNLPGRTCGPDGIFPSADDSCAVGAKCQFWASNGQLRGSRSSDFDWPLIDATFPYPLTP